MDKIKHKYEKAELPEALKPFAVEQDGMMVINFDDSVALATNPALASNNAALKAEKTEIKKKYDDLVTSTGTISTELNELRTKVATGANISQAELAIVTALKGIDGTPDEIKKMIEEYPTLKGTISQFAVEAENRKIAEAMGWKPNVFSDLRNHPEKSKDLKFEIVGVEKDGKPTNQVHVTFKDVSGIEKKVELSEFVKTNDSWSPFLPALQTAENTGATWLPQSGAGDQQQQPKSVVAEHIEKRNAEAKARGNAFSPPVPVAPTQPTA